MDTFGIPLTFIIITALILWAIIGGKGWWWLKAIMVIGTFLFGVVLWHSLETLEGWPTEEPMPEKFEIKWIVVEEPNMKTGEKGEILVWSKNMTEDYKTASSPIPLLHNKEQSDDPRLHRLPYSREMHKQAQDIQKKIAFGGKYYGEMKDGKMKGKGEGNGKAGNGKGKGEGQGNGKTGGKKGDGGSLSQEQDPIFHELPPPYFIPKDM